MSLYTDPVAPAIPAPPSNPPAGWYDHPDGGQRWWDGSAWTALTPPPPPAPTPVAPVQEDEKAGGIVVGGYIFAALMPIIGFVLGLVAATRPAKATSKHGIWIIVVSVVAFFIWAAIISAGYESTTYDYTY